MAILPIRVFGDPVLRQPAAEIQNIDSSLVRLANDMIETMYAAPGIGLAGPQVGVQKRIFVYDVQDDTGANVVINPVIHSLSGTWTYEEGCLSVPGLYFEFDRPREVHLTAIDLDGNEVEHHGEELIARMFQHEVDHLEGKIVLDRIEKDQRNEAMRILRERLMSSPNGQ